MMKSQWRGYAVELLVVVLLLMVFRSSNGRNLAISQQYNGSNSSVVDAEYDSSKRKPQAEKIVGATNVANDSSTQQGLKQRDTKEKSAVNLKVENEEKVAESGFASTLQMEAATFLSSTISPPITPTTSPNFLLILDPLTLAETTPSRISVDLESNDNVSEGFSSIDVDAADLLSITPTTYRPARPSVTPNSSAKERERKLMNVLAARRNALHRGSFRTRVGTTGRTATVASLETTSKTPTDPRSICIRNCTKNFTRRTTASCMRQCSNFSRTSWPVINSTATGSMIIVRSASRNSLGAQALDRDNNEILFTDESSHGLFVVAKDQNDTSNHISDATKRAKFRPRNKLLSSITVSPSSIEEDDIQPYLYFGQKLPPIRPASLTITSVSEDHPKLLEVSAAQLGSTTPASLVSTPTLSAVERSRSRYKYRDRGYVNTRRFPIRASALGSVNPLENRSAILLNTKDNTTTIQKETSDSGTLESEGISEKNMEKKAISKIAQIQSTTSSDSSTPLIIKVFGEEEETSQTDDSINESVTKLTSSVESTTVHKTGSIGTTLNILSNNQTQSTTSSPSMLMKTVSKSAAVKIPFHRAYPTTIRTSSTTSTSPASKATAIETAYSETTPIYISTTPFTLISSSSTTAKTKSIIKEDIEKLRALGPSLTQVIENDENFVIFLNQTASHPYPLFDTDTTDTTVSILGTTVLTSVRSTVNPRAENPSGAVEYTSTEMNKVSRPSFVGIIEAAPIENPTRNEPPSESGADIKYTYVTDESKVSLEMRRVNIATMVLAGIGIIPLFALILYLVRSYLPRRGAKNEEDFDVCITDQQPISPVKKLDSKYRSKSEEEDCDADHHTVHTSHHHSAHHMPMVSHGKTTSRDANHNNRYDEQSSVTSDQEFDRNNIRLKSLLGEGNFGQVWKAEADDLSGHFGATRIVAVKTIRKCSAQVSLKEEADIMRKLGSHQNVVTLLGACVEIEPHMLIMEYAMRGRLLSLLRAARSATNILPASVPGGRSLSPLSPRTLGGFALDIACGMEYIAERRIVHRDLAARNILLDHNGICKICDFGMSFDLDSERRRKEEEKNSVNEIVRSNTKKNKFDFGSRFIMNHWNNNFNGQESSLTSTKDDNEKKPNAHGHGHDTISRKPALPIRWMAPEALQYHIFTRETDVWAFGIVLWEIATLGSTPYAHLSGREVIRRVPSGLRPELPKEGRHEFYNLMNRCWQNDPHQRPSFTYARKEISYYLHKWVDDDSTASDYMDVSGFSEDLEHGMVYFNHRISEFECEI
ncbi:serine-rich adhesin for platelets [Anastrepha obliqua]|uniref:serine-rich adhesin for platelets n=1 Tax=Anastrepha obliqua TaxID=95512 RepID=UPI002409891B|nr:serine-rich adhesin for platelets [Anastrepha obliqua]XP_054736131.1 serine-rich adhesin for platelets [Anastrepha obliqua]XP_054736132.1 serine-rich adhesin for platelets [Anastrepha obliqua]